MDQTPTIPISQHNAIILQVITLLDGPDHAAGLSPEVRIKHALAYLYGEALYFTTADLEWLDPMVQGYFAQFPGLTRSPQED